MASRDEATLPTITVEEASEDTSPREVDGTQTIVEGEVSSPLNSLTLKHVHWTLREVFPFPDLPKGPVGGRVRQFYKNWEKLTNDPVILQTVQGWEIPWLEHPPQMRSTPALTYSQEEKKLISIEIKSMISKRAIHPVPWEEGQQLSSIFTRPKKEGKVRTIINLKRLNQFIPYVHFKMDKLTDLKSLLRKNDFMVKIDLKDAYWSIPIHKDSRKFLRFMWEGQLYEFLVLAFGLGPAPRIFT